MDGIEGLYNLRRLALCSGIESLEPISQLYQLEELIIQDTKVSDLSPLAGLRNLKRVEIRGSQVSDLTPLANLTRLETLVIANSQVEDLTPLSNLSTIKRLFLYNNQIRDLRPLAGMINLQVLNVSDNQITNVMPLANKQHLLNLYIARNQVEDVTPLTTLPKLMGLDIRCNPAGINGQLSMLENLQWVDARCTDIINPEVPEDCLTRCGRADEICLYVNGICLEVDQPPIVESGCTLLPLSAVMRAIGAEVSWEADTRTAVAVYNEKTLRIPIDQPHAYIDGNRFDVFYRTQIRNGRTMIHSRMLIDAFQLRIHFDAENRVVLIES